MVDRVRSAPLVRCGDARAQRSVRASMSKQKGGAFERDCCITLSLWISGGERKDLLWRSAMSGGRATVSRGAVRQAGDICAVAPEGHMLTDECFIECKHHRDLFLHQLLMGRGVLAKFWIAARRQAVTYGRAPIIIARQNMYPTLLLTEARGPFWRAAAGAGLQYASVQLEREGGVIYIYQLKQILGLPYPVNR